MALAGLALLSGCGSDAGGLTRLEGRLQVHRGDDATMVESVTFDTLPLGGQATVQLGLHNAGDGDLRICLAAGPRDRSCPEHARIEPAAGAFAFHLEAAMEESGHAHIPGRQMAVLSVRFEPQVEGPHAAQLVIAHDGSNGPTHIVQLRGDALAPSVEIAPEAIDFGPVTVGQHHTERLALRNQTRFIQSLQILPLPQASVVFSLRSPDGREVPYDETFSGTIPANGELALMVQFAPDARRDYALPLTLKFCEQCEAKVPLRGTGVQPSFEVDPATHDFGEVPEGAERTAQFTVTNTGDDPLRVLSVEPGPGSPDAFVPSLPEAPADVAPGEAVAFSVTFTAGTPGDVRGDILVLTNAFDDPASKSDESLGIVSVRGVSVGPRLVALPSRVHFGTVPLGMRQERALIVSNTGNRPLRVDDIELSLESREIDWVRAPSLPLSLSPGASEELRLAYVPEDAGQDTAKVSLRSDAAAVDIEVVGIGGAPDECAINVAPSRAQFGLVERGRRITLPVAIRNVGFKTCMVSNIHKTGDAEFEVHVPGGVDALRIPPSGVAQLQVSYSPEAYGRHEGVLAFESNDPAQAEIAVPLEGQSGESLVRIIPSALDFGTVPVLCASAERQVKVYNTGASPVTLEAAYLDGSTSLEFNLSTPRLPLRLAGGEQTTLRMRYAPKEIEVDSGVLFVKHSDSAVPIAVSLTGRAEASPDVSDRFEQVPAPVADVLFVVDNSCSMEDEQAALGENLGAFLSFADAEGVDYQVAVTTTDVRTVGSGISAGERGRFVGSPRILNSQTPNRDQIFLRTVTEGVGGTSGSGVEAGLEAAYLALTDPLVNGTNAGFLREDASLALVFVSDEEDQSERSDDFYLDFFRNLKGFASNRMSMSAVVGPSPHGCNGARPGRRYLKMAAQTGGVTGNICARDWGQTLGSIGVTSFGLKRQFILSSTAIDDTVEVFVNGERVSRQATNGDVHWSVHPADGRLVFEPGAVPPKGADIEVRYRVACQ